MNILDHGSAAIFKEGLLNAARALDRGSLDQCVNVLRSLPLTMCGDAMRLVAIALWKRAVSNAGDGSGLSVDDEERALMAVDCIASAVENEFKMWPAYSALPELEQSLGPSDAAALVAAALWSRVLAAHEGVFAAVFELFFRGGDWQRLDAAWRQFLEKRLEYVPGYWLFLLHSKSLKQETHEHRAAAISDCLRLARRDDLIPLFSVYLLQMRQADTREILEAAKALSDPRHRARVAEYLVGQGLVIEDLKEVVESYRDLVEDPSIEHPAAFFMKARLANAEGRWADVLTLAELARKAPEHRHPADLLCANALARLGKLEDAREMLRSVTEAQSSMPFHGARAAFVKVTVELLEEGVTLPECMNSPVLQEGPGRPLAQSLWVGRSLRWIEQLAIKSYLDNGWRFQLYVYDDPDNVPDGCEVLDANGIIPRKEVFREGFGSGLHAGSVGAFSDLFRYRLLYERGGMWTDTDVINRKRFDPDGERFVSTEISDAGVVSINGAIMAAPAGDVFVGRAYERACELLNSERMFFTRIGPYLLAELLIEIGVANVKQMPPSFLSPISWMNTALLLRPFETVSALPAIRNATNVHVYTEMWRLLGLGLDRPPDRETFLGRLYDFHLAPVAEQVRSVQ